MSVKSQTIEQKVADNSPELDQTWKYWESAKSPFASAVFVLPLLILYEYFVFHLPADEINNGAHQWANKLLLMVGIDDLIIPLVVLLILFLWQYVSRRAIEVSYKTLVGMWSESILFAMILIGLGQAQQLAMIGRISPEVERGNQTWQPIFLQINQSEEYQARGTLALFDNQNEAVLVDQEIKAVISTTSQSDQNQQRLQQGHIAFNQGKLEHPRERFISYLGAGIYEETFFRLLLIPLLFYSFKPVFYFTSVSMLISLIVSSLIFALAHEVIPIANHTMHVLPKMIIDALANDTYRQFVFAFRVMAGFYFGILFYLRGFGIAVGAHLVYDIFVGIMLK